MTTNRSYIEKADLTLADLTTDGGKLLPAQAKKFMQIMTKEAKLLKMCTFVPMAAQKHEIDKIRFEGRILHAASEGMALPEGKRSKPTTSKVELDSKLYKGEVRLTNEVVEDNIERGELKQTIMDLLGKRVGLDVEEFAIQGDTASSDPDLAIQDGFLKLATSHIVNVADAPISKTVWRDMLRAMPNEYLKSLSSLRFFTSVKAELEYRDSVANRATQRGDQYLLEAAAISYAGVGIESIPLFPETIPHSALNTTNALLCDPKNLTVGVWREIKIETDKNISEGIVLFVVTTRVAYKIQHEDATVKATNILMAA